jgi:hypothetical protein
VENGFIDINISKVFEFNTFDEKNHKYKVKLELIELQDNKHLMGLFDNKIYKVPIILILFDLSNEKSFE